MRELVAAVVIILVLPAENGIAQDFEFSDIKDILQVGGSVEIKERIKTRTSRNLDNPIEDYIGNFFKSNDVSMKVPFGSTVTFNGRGLDNGEFDLKLNLNSGNDVQGRKKSRIKKIITPILVVLVLKAITLIPLALGLLGLKTWNALQLAFFSFVTSVVLAVWKLSAKFSDHHPPHIIHEAIHDVHVPHVYHDSHHDHHVVHHGHHHDDYYDDEHHHDPWSHHYQRADVNAQQMAYNQYVPETNV